MLNTRSSAPHLWNVATLGELVVRGDLDIEIGVRLSSDQTTAGEPGIPVVMPENIRDCKLCPDGIAHARPDAVLNAERFRLRRGDIVCSRRGDLTRYAMIDGQSDGWLCGNGCLRLRFRSEVLDPRFAYFYFRQPRVGEWLMSRAVGSTVSHINRHSLAKMPLSIPPYREQREIADFLAVIEQKLDHNIALNASLFELARLYFEQSLCGFNPLLLDDAGRCGPLPDGCRIVRLSECCRRMEIGSTPGPADDADKSGTIPWLVSEEVRNRFIVSAKRTLSPRTVVEEGLKVWPRGTTVVALFGATAGLSAWLDVDASANQACCGLVPAEDFSAYNFLYCSQLGAHLNQLRQGSVRQNLNKKTLADFDIVVPPAAALKAVETQARPLLEQMAAVVRQSATLVQLRDSLLPQLVEGQRRFKSSELQ